MTYQTGYFADPNGPQRTATKVHVVKGPGHHPICGAQIHIASKFQWCSSRINLDYIECAHCQRMAEKLP